MENFKIEDIGQNSDTDEIQTEKQTCVLEENDAQCGYVFYNEITRLLKFYCTYCRETYDNIEYYCQHLSDHINVSYEDTYSEDETDGYTNNIEDEIIGLEEKESLSYVMLKNEMMDTSSSAQKIDEDTRDAFEYEQKLEEKSLCNENIDSTDCIDNLNKSDEMLIEEIEDSADIGAEILEDDGNNSSYILPATGPTELPQCNEKQDSIEENSVKQLKNGKSFEECFIKETNIDRIRSEGVCVLKEKSHVNRNSTQRKRSNIQELLRLKRRRRKVTTVKVIAVKNRIAELYERIQSEQQKSQQLFSNDFIKENHEQETQDAIESLIKDKSETNVIKTEMMENHELPTDDISIQSTSEISRKIIGETLITLIPEGTKIPNKMPCPLKTPNSNEFINNETLPNENNKIIHYKQEEKKEKMAVCPACGKTFRSHFSLTIHKRIHYLESDSNVKLAHKCSDCDQLFNKLSQLKHHVETVHYPEGFICKICDRQLSSLSLLERHMIKVHLDRPFNCKKCNKNFSDPLTYEEHLASHNSGEVFKCSTCGRKYSTEYFLQEHMRNHKEQVPQTCVVCGKITLRITQHMKIHTPRPKRLLSCSECGKVFNFSSGLSHHFKIMHKLPRPPPKPKKETQSTTTYKRKRRSRINERSSTNKKKPLLNSCPTGPSLFADKEKFSNQIIEEQIEIPHEIYGSSTGAVISYLDRKDHQVVEQPSDRQNSSPSYSVMNSNTQQQQVIIQNIQQDNIINHKEEEAKRVIVELIQNSAYSTFFPDNFSSVLEVTPPIAREETISAVNSIVHEC